MKNIMTYSKGVPIWWISYEIL